ncbi:hypothetical protein GCM10010415_65890 [Streptomyces atrovirens]
MTAEVFRHLADVADADRVNSTRDWYEKWDFPGGTPSRAPNYYHNEDDDPIDCRPERSFEFGGDQDLYSDGLLECAGCGHMNPESLDERRLCPYCRPDGPTGDGKVPTAFHALLDQHGISRSKSWSRGVRPA